MRIKKILAAFAAAVMAASAVAVTAFADSKGVKISEKNFPDEVFRGYVSDNFDTDKNGYLSKEERKAVTEINVGNKWEGYRWDNPVESLKGVEYFTRLKKIDCTEGNLTSIDVSKNTELEKLYCNGNKLKKLNLKNNTELVELSCFENRIKSLDISSCTKLEHLMCADNKLTELDVSNCPKLDELNCYRNDITELKINIARSITVIKCDDNVKIIEP